MFTGIVQDVGKIIGVTKKQDAVTFTVESKKLVPLLNIGDSVSIDGACLTVVRKENEHFDVEAIPETLDRTICKHYQEGSLVNLEPAMQMTDRFHGHMVTGHVDFTGKAQYEKTGDKAVQLRVEFGPEYAKYFALKGSVTINGVSLTITKLLTKSFEVNIIPHTRKNTNLEVKEDLNKDFEVNVEIDLIARYLENLLNAKEGESNYFFLKERGFI